MSLASLPQQGILGGRLHEAVGEVENVPYFTFLVPNKTLSNTQLVVINLFLPMWYIYNPYFCMVMETMANLTNKAISQRDKTHKHLLEIAGKVRAADDSGTPEALGDAIWEHFPAEKRSAARANGDVYLYDFMSVVQGGHRERRQILWHLFH